MLWLVDAKTITLSENEKRIRSLNMDSYMNTKMQLPAIIFLKDNMFIELIGGNYDIKYGWSTNLKAFSKNPQPLRMVQFGFNFLIQQLKTTNKQN